MRILNGLASEDSARAKSARDVLPGLFGAKVAKEMLRPPGTTEVSRFESRHQPASSTGCSGAMEGQWRRLADADGGVTKEACPSPASEFLRRTPLRQLRSRPPLYFHIDACQ